MIKAENLRIGDLVRYGKNIITVQAIHTNYEEGFIKNISTYTEYMVSVIVSVGEYDYTCVLAVTEDLEAGQAKFVIEKEVIDADKSS